MTSRTLPSRRATRLAVVALAGVLALAGCSEDGEPDADPTPSTGTPTTSDEPTDETTSPSAPTPTNDPSSKPPAVGDTALVYYATDTPTGTRLMAEPTELGGEPSTLREVAGFVAAGSPADPDYVGLFPTEARARLGSVEVTADATIEVEVRGDGWARRPAGTSAADAALAVQSLVYSLQAAVDEKLPVVVVDRAGEPTTLFGVDTAGGVRAAAQPRVLAPVNVLTPAEGATVSGSFPLEGRQQACEATVRWQLLDGSGATVKEGSAMGRLFSPRRLTPFETTVRLGGVRPGTYTLAVSTDDPSGGEGPGPTTDTKTVEVE